MRRPPLAAAALLLIRAGPPAAADVPVDVNRPFVDDHQRRRRHPCHGRNPTAFDGQ